MRRRLPDFLIIGAIRSGTTSLARYLGAHPEVFMAKNKEVRFFNSHYGRGLDWYASHFEQAGPAQKCGEGTPAYMASRIAVDRMGQAIPDALLIALLRDPITRAWSHYWMRRERGQEGREFMRAIEEEVDLISTQGPDAGRAPYLANGLYADSLSHVLRVYPRQQLKVLVFEEMVHDPEDTYRQSCRFLGIDQSQTPEELGRPINAYISLRSLWLRNLMKKSPTPIARLIGRMNARTRVTYPDMSANARERLAEFFRTPNQDLMRLMGREIRGWS